MLGKIAFISGSPKPSPTYLITHYEPLLESAIAANHSYIVGPAPGIDTLVLQFLVAQHVDPSKITTSWRSSAGGRPSASECCAEGTDRKLVTIYLTEWEGRALRPSLKSFEELGG
jgi:hypothetical protein